MGLDPREKIRAGGRHLKQQPGRIAIKAMAGMRSHKACTEEEKQRA